MAPQSVLKQAADNWENNGQTIHEAVAEYFNAWEAGVKDDGNVWLKGEGGVSYPDDTALCGLVAWLADRNMIES